MPSASFANALFHGRSTRLASRYLPPYSPDLNKIEQCWSWLKSRIRKQLDQFDCLRDAIEDVLRFTS